MPRRSQVSVALEETLEGDAPINEPTTQKSSGFDFNKYKIDNTPVSQTVEIDGDGNYPINLVFADDVVECLLRLIREKDKTYKTYNVCGDESITINKLIKFLKGELDVESHKVVETSDSLFPNQSFEFSNEKIKKDYSINFTNTENGIKKYVREYNEL